MYKKRGIALLLAICMLTGLPYMAENVFATSAEDKKNEAENNLNDVNSEIEDIENSQQQIENELTQTRIELADLLSAQSTLEDEIAKNQEAIAQTQVELEQAEKDEQEQYEAMKRRIQYMYENSTQDSLLDAIMGAKSFADMLKRVEYVAEVHKADRELTEEYQVTVQLVKAKQQELREEQDTLLAKQEAYLGQQFQIEEMIAQLEGEADAYATQLASAKAKAEEYLQTIEEQNEIIRKEAEEAERKRKEEEERKRREEEERKKREEEEKKKQEEENNKNNSNNSSNSNTGNTENTGNKVPTNPKGQEIVDYARQFVGNPYVWGGNSLTNGCDCSGFVHLVYKHFGYDLPRYSMSFQYVGEAVSKEDIQPGDIVVYARKNGVGHVAIYMGNGKIVEAQSSSAGITDNRKLENREIIAIRRIVD